MWRRKSLRNDGDGVRLAKMPSEYRRMHALINAAFREVTGAPEHEHMHLAIYRARLRNGEIVYRHSESYGWPEPRIYRDKERGDVIYGRVHYGRIPLPTLEDAARESLRWEWLVFTEGPLVLEPKLQKAVEARIPGARLTMGGASSGGNQGSFVIVLGRKKIAPLPDREGRRAQFLALAEQMFDLLCPDK
jgi:hypothetical protein